MSARTPWPLRECEPWCTEGNGHVDEHPDDRGCMSNRQTVDTSLRPAVKFGSGEWAMDCLKVSLRREVRASEPVVVLYDESGLNGGMDLTLDEAKRLAESLRQIVELHDTE